MEHVAFLQGIHINLAGGSCGVCKPRRAGWGKLVSCPWWLRLLDVRAPAVLARRTPATPALGARHTLQPKPAATKRVCARPQAGCVHLPNSGMRSCRDRILKIGGEKTPESQLWVSCEVLPEGVSPHPHPIKPHLTCFKKHLSIH